MSVEQTPPVTVITVPPETTTTTAPTTTTTAPTTTTLAPAEPTEVTTATTVVPTTDDLSGEAPEEGLVLLVFLGVAMLVGLLVGLFVLLRRQRKTDLAAKLQPAAPVDQQQLVARLRELASRPVESEEGPDSPIVDDATVADLYPWIESPDDLTLVVDLTTAEALQQAGVQSLEQLAHLSDAEASELRAAGIDVDGSILTAAAEIVMSKQAKADPD